MRLFKSPLFILIVMALSLSACYDDYLIDDMGFTDVYFPASKRPRSIVAGEGLQIKLGINLGGTRENNEDQRVEFAIVDSLLDNTSYTLLPADYYEMTTEGSDPLEVIIPKNDFIGYISLKFDSAKVANDLNFKDFNYALPLAITSTTTDSVLASKATMIVPIKVMNTYEGNYYSIGKRYLNDSIVASYGAMDDYTIAPVRALVSTMMDTVTVDGISNFGGDGYSMQLVIAQDNSVKILADTTSIYQVVQDSTSTWDPQKRFFELCYTYTENGDTYKVRDTYVFRNRKRDGINEWRWEGFEGN